MTLSKLFGFLFLCICILFGNSFSHGSRKLKDIQNPMIYPSKCGREGVEKSAICDPDLILTKKEKDLLEGYINDVKNAQLGVAIIAKADTTEYLPLKGDDSLISFAKGIHNKWGVGDKEKQNGVLIFLSVLDRYVYLSVGEGLSIQLPYNKLQSIIEEIRPELKNQDYGRGLLEAISFLDYAINGKEAANHPIPPSSWTFQELFNNSFAALGLFFIVIVFVSKCWVKRHRTNETYLRNFIREVDNIEETEYNSTTCPICLEEFSRVIELQQRNSDAFHHIESNELSQESQSTTNNSNKVPMALQCGHIFCKECLQNYLESSQLHHQHLQCPICRRDFDFDANQSPAFPNQTNLSFWQRNFTFLWLNPLFSTSTSSGYQPLDSRYQYDIPDENHNRVLDVRYRLHRLRALSPNLFNDQEYNHLTRYLDNGLMSEFRDELRRRKTEVDANIMWYNTHNNSSSSGSHGSNSSYGGGSSFSGAGGHF